MSARHHGFTLIELLVVLVLIGIITALAVINIGPRENPAEREARRLAAVVAAAGREAVLEARELGLVVDARGYRFVRLDDNQWRAAAFEHDRQLGPHRLPEAVRLEIGTDDLPGARRPGDDDSDDGARPHILILSSGEITPFRATFRLEGTGRAAWFVSGDLDGAVDVGREEGAP